MYDEHEAMADMITAGVLPLPDIGFDTADSLDTPVDNSEAPAVKVADPMRPAAKRGRYYLPDPNTGKSRSWQRVTNFVKMSDDTYHLELWKQRCVAKGIQIMAAQDPRFMSRLAGLEVKADRSEINRIVEEAMDAAEAYKNADEGTALHTSTELVDMANGDLNRAPVHHRIKVRMYLDALAANGLKVVPGMVERVTVSDRFGTAGTFDRVFRLGDGSYVIGDLKTGDSVDLAMPSIAAQLDCYRDGINTHGIFNGHRYDDSLKVRDDFGIVVHLPSTRDEVSVIKVDLASGRLINETNLHIQQTRKLKAQHVSCEFEAGVYGADRDATDAHWLERMNAAYTRAELVQVARTAKGFGQWNERLSGQARILAAEFDSENAAIN